MRELAVAVESVCVYICLCTNTIHCLAYPQEEREESTAAMHAKGMGYVFCLLHIFTARNKERQFHFEIVKIPRRVPRGSPPRGLFPAAQGGLPSIIPTIYTYTATSVGTEVLLIITKCREEKGKVKQNKPLLLHA
jgi:hypothetical protein